MRRNRLDDRTADRLLAGGVAPADAPPGYAELAGLVAASKQPATAAELASEPAVVAMVADAARSASAAPTTPRKKMLAKILTAKAAALAAVTFIGAGAAAAATNTLPDPAQSAVSSVAKKVGLDVPKPKKSEKSEDAGERGKGPDVTGSAKKGLCNAASRGEGEKKGVAFRNLAAAADDAGQSVEEYCAAVTTTTTAAEGDAEEQKVHENNGKSEDHSGPPATAGKSADHANVTTPNKGAASEDAPGTNGDKGRETADERGGGKSSNGKGNSQEGEG